MKGACDCHRRHLPRRDPPRQHLRERGDHRRRHIAHRRELAAERSVIMGSVVNWVVMVLALLWALIQAVESPGNGEEKRAEVIERMGVLLAALPIPAWAKAVFGCAPVLGVLVDLLVATGKRNGWFASLPDVSIGVAVGEPG